MNEEKDTASGNDWTRTMASVNDAFDKDPAASINVMLRTTAFTDRQTGRSFLVRHADNGSNVIELYHLGGETDVRIIHIESLYGEWLGLEPRAAAWPTTGEQFERLQREADEHITALGLGPLPSLAKEMRPRRSAAGNGVGIQNDRSVVLKEMRPRRSAAGNNFQGNEETGAH